MRKEERVWLDLKFVPREPMVTGQAFVVNTRGESIIQLGHGCATVHELACLIEQLKSDLDSIWEEGCRKITADHHKTP